MHDVTCQCSAPCSVLILKLNFDNSLILISPQPDLVSFQLFFQSREQVAVREGQIRRIGWVIKILEAQVGQFLLGCK
jgi:hypothetical protein